MSYRSYFVLFCSLKITMLWLIFEEKSFGSKTNCSHFCENRKWSFGRKSLLSVLGQFLRKKPHFGHKSSMPLIHKISKNNSKIKLSKCDFAGKTQKKGDVTAVRFYFLFLYTAEDFFLPRKKKPFFWVGKSIFPIEIYRGGRGYDGLSMPRKQTFLWILWFSHVYFC